jgi:hypothetical protein
MKLIRCFHCDKYTPEGQQLCRGCGAELVDYGKNSQLPPGFVLDSNRNWNAKTWSINRSSIWNRFLRQIEWKATGVIVCLIGLFLWLKRSEIAEGYAKMLRAPRESISGLVGLAFAGAVLLMLIFVYCAPTIIASRTNHRQTTAIAVLNILFGWTLVGYAVALVWALTKSGRTEKGF